MMITPHNPAWVAEFSALRDVYLTELGGLIVRVEHVGSTAVPGLGAKPIIDIDLVMGDYAAFPGIVQSLGRLGYSHQGDQGIRHREVFKRQEDTVPFTRSRRQWMMHHLYVCPVQSVELWRHLAFRDALRARADFREEYEKMKRSIADRSGDDRKAYARIKEIECRALVERVLNEMPNQAS